MKINKAIRDIRKYLRLVNPKALYYLGLPRPAEHMAVLVELGFSSPPLVGERVLPPANKGPSSKKNADGYEIVHRDRPKETAFRQMEWSWKEFRGRYDFEEKTDIVDVPYQRYPRTTIAPYAIELETRVNSAGHVVLVSGPFLQSEADMERATNTARMFVEQFGECEVLTERLEPLAATQIRHLNWEVLPPGKNPWASAQPALKQAISRAEAGNQPVIRARFEAVGSHEPEFVAIGKRGFEGYLIFGFPAKQLFVLECLEVNNATYILGDDWETISFMSKAEILSAERHKYRLIHRKNWFANLGRVIEGKQLQL